MTPSIPHCPVCRKPVDPDVTPAMPFCSKRCQQIDLGRWLGENYSLPEPGDEEAGEEE